MRTSRIVKRISKAIYRVPTFKLLLKILTFIIISNVYNSELTRVTPNLTVSVRRQRRGAILMSASSGLRVKREGRGSAGPWEDRGVGVD